MRPFAPVLLLALAACSSSTPGAAAPAPAPVRDELRVRGNANFNLETYTPSSSISRTIAVAPDRAWLALPGVLQGLGFEITQVDDSLRRITARRPRTRRALGGKVHSQLLSCGDSGGRPIASTHDVEMTVATTVVPAGTGTSFATEVSATAIPNTTAGNRVRCTANAAIGNIIADALADWAK